MQPLQRHQPRARAAGLALALAATCGADAAHAQIDVFGATPQERRVEINTTVVCRSGQTRERNYCRRPDPRPCYRPARRCAVRCPEHQRYVARRNACEWRAGCEPPTADAPSPCANTAGGGWLRRVAFGEGARSGGAAPSAERVAQLDIFGGVPAPPRTELNFHDHRCPAGWTNYRDGSCRAPCEWRNSPCYCPTGFCKVGSVCRVRDPAAPAC